MNRFANTSDSGFSLLEVVVSFVIFAVVAGSATAAIVSALQASHGSQQRVDAAQVAQQFVAQVQSSPGTMHVESAKQIPAALKNEAFTVTRTLKPCLPSSTSPQSCTQDPNGTCATGDYWAVTVLATQAQTGKFLARNDSVVTC